jgi:predicted small metal-binding protein
MTKTFTCSELEGLCDEKFSGETLDGVMQNAVPHMMGDEAHKTHIMNIEKTTGETKEMWIARMQKAFAEKPADA